jgi:glutamate transport system permease protein
VRSGINSVSPGQAEAARSIGLTFNQSLRYVVMPQALRSVVPPLGSVIIAMIKNSAIVGAFGVGGELFSLIGALTGSQGYSALPVITGVALGYLAITIPGGLFLQYLERRVAVAR